MSTASETLSPPPSLTDGEGSGTPTPTRPDTSSHPSSTDPETPTQTWNDNAPTITPTVDGNGPESPSSSQVHHSDNGNTVSIDPHSPGSAPPYTPWSPTYHQDPTPAPVPHTPILSTIKTPSTSVWFTPITVTDRNGSIRSTSTRLSSVFQPGAVVTAPPIAEETDAGGTSANRNGLGLNNIAIIVGGTLGGLIALGLLIALIIFMRRPRLKGTSSKPAIDRKYGADFGATTAEKRTFLSEPLTDADIGRPAPGTFVSTAYYPTGGQSHTPSLSSHPSVYSPGGTSVAAPPMHVLGNSAPFTKSTMPMYSSGVMSATNAVNHSLVANNNIAPPVTQTQPYVPPQNWPSGAASLPPPPRPQRSVRGPRQLAAVNRTSSNGSSMSSRTTNSRTTNTAPSDSYKPPLPQTQEVVESREELPPAYDRVFHHQRDLSTNSSTPLLHRS